MSEKKRKFNVLDVVAILLIIAIIAGGVWYFAGRNNTETTATAQKELEFDVLVTDVSVEVAENVKIGSNIKFGKGSSGKGTLVNVKEEPYVSLQKDTVNGKYVWSEHPGRVQLTATIKTSVTETEDKFMAADEQVAIGNEMPFLGVGFGFSECYIVDMREVTK